MLSYCLKSHNKGKSVIAEKFIRTLKKIINTLLKFLIIFILIN